MGIILWILFGALVGWLASLITGSNRRMGAIANIIVGLIGSVLGGWLASLLGIGTYDKFSLGGLAIAVLGAIILLALINLISGRKN